MFVIYLLWKQDNEIVFLFKTQKFTEKQVHREDPPNNTGLPCLQSQATSSILNEKVWKGLENNANLH